ncbi:leucine-rich repeat-containing protein 34 [Anableps anableps]
MADKSISESYKAICGERGVKINPFVLENLERTTTTSCSTLNLTANRKQKDLQKVCDDDVLALSKLLLGNRTVTGLDLRYNDVGDGGAAHLAQFLEVMDGPLRSLDLTFNNIQADGAEVLANSLQGNGSLRSLRLSGNKIGRRGGVQLASMLQVNKTLQELELADCDLETQSVIALGITLRNNSTLQSMDLSRPLFFSLQEEWAVRFSDMFSMNSSLVELHLGKLNLTDTGMQRLAEGLKRNHSLRYLDLRCNHVTQDGALHLAEVLKQNSALEIIDLSSNRIEDAGAESLSDAISWHGCILREISVCRNNIKTKGLVCLAQALKNNSILTHIYIWGNHMDEAVCLAFRELISSGRLLPEQTDVRPWEADGQVFLAEVSHYLRKHIFYIDGNNQDSG